MEFSGFIVAGGIRWRCEADADASPKPFIWKIAGDEPWPLFGGGCGGA